MLKQLVIALTAVLSTASSAHAGAVMIPIIVPVAPPVMVTNPADYNAIHTVAVVSAIGQTLNMRNVHFIGVQSKSVDITNWKLDDEATDMLKRYLGGRFQFKDVPYDRTALAAIPNGAWDNFFSTFSTYLKTLPAQGIDAFILLRPDLEYHDPGVPGIAIDNGNGLTDTLPVIWANYEIDIIDTHTLKIIGKAFSRVALRSGAPPTFVGIVAPPSLALGDDFALSEKQRLLLHAIVKKLMEASLVETIRSLNFGISLPEAGARTLIPIPPNEKPYPSLKSIAVVSAIGDQLEERKWGAIWNRDNYVLPIPDWDIDHKIESAIRAALDKRFAVKDVPVDREALSHASLLDKDGKFAPSFPGLMPTRDVDAYLVVSKFPLSQTLEGPGRNGIGIFHTEMTIGTDMTAVYASFTVELVDARTLKVISARAGIQSPDRPVAAPRLDVGDTAWPSSPPQLSSGQTAEIRASVEDILANSIPETLLVLGLTGMMPADRPPPVSSQSRGNN